MFDITAVIPTYNRAKLLSRSIESVLNQTLQPDQIIVVDDGSTDNTPAVCKPYVGRIEYVRDQNRGASAARNLGIERARHRWIAFLDSDDYWEPIHLERLMAAVRSTAGEAAVYFSDMKMPEEEGGGTLWQLVGFQPNAAVHMVRDATAWALMKRQPMMLQAAVINKHALQQTGGLDVRFRLSHDSYIFCQLLIGKTACAVTGVGCVQTSDDTSLTRLSMEIPLNSVAKARESATMWSEVLHNQRELPSAFHRLVRYNAAGSRWQVGLDLIRSGSYGRGLVMLSRAAAIDPRFVLWLLRHGTVRGYEETVRPWCAEVNSTLWLSERANAQASRQAGLSKGIIRL